MAHAFDPDTARIEYSHQGQDGREAQSDSTSVVTADNAAHTVRTKWSFSKVGRGIYSNCIKPLLSSHHSPSYDATSVSIGLVVGFIIPVGGQLLFLGLLRLLFPFNYIVAAGFTFVSNPLNMIPLYYGYYRLGSFVLGRPASLNFHCFERLMHPILDKSYFWDALNAFAELGSELLIPWAVAAVILATIFGVTGYALTYTIQKKRCINAAQKLGLEYKAYLKRMQDSAPS